MIVRCSLHRMVMTTQTLMVRWSPHQLRITTVRDYVIDYSGHRGASIAFADSAQRVISEIDLAVGTPAGVIATGGRCTASPIDLTNMLATVRFTTAGGHQRFAATVGAWAKGFDGRHKVTPRLGAACHAQRVLRALARDTGAGAHRAWSSQARSARWDWRLAS